MNIEAHVRELLSACQSIPLFYVEAGSRLWGTETETSDYDVRGVHLQSRHWYFDYHKHRDVIDLREPGLDFLSFELDKFFTLLEQSNPTCLEWLRSHIIYFVDLG